MGMAASQARFLGLTARKTNVEYEGQQINQQRTTLANQTANYYNQLLGMSVPTPPSVSDYTKTVYTFQDGNLSNCITTMVAQASGEYKVSYISSWQNDFAPVSNGVAIVFDDGSNYRIGNDYLDELEDTLNRQGIYYTSLDSNAQSDLIKEETQYKALLDKKYGSQDWYVRYIKNTTNGEWEPYFYSKTEVTGANYDSNGQSQSAIKVYKMGSAQETLEVKGVSARLEKDATGRYINITLNAGSSNEVTYSLTTNTTTDQAAYDDAMNQYEFDKAKYDQSIQEVNAKIEIIQSQDKNLELRLKQLDTEQKAISQEMEAVQKVVDKNVDTTFKTFG